MIQFIECKKSGYPARTEENISKSDVTIAIALDFKSAGEVLTKKLCDKLGKPYFDFQLPTVPIASVVEIEKFCQKLLHFPNIDVLNIAGNGIYTLNPIYTQEDLNLGLTMLLSFIKNKIGVDLVCSGGQTGIDEAAIIAAERLNIPALVLAPKGWLFRDKNYNNFADETLFKQRFKTI